LCLIVPTHTRGLSATDDKIDEETGRKLAAQAIKARTPARNLSAFLIDSRMSELPLVAQLVPSPFQAPSACLGVPVLQKELLQAFFSSREKAVLAIKTSGRPSITDTAANSLVVLA
jgi:hypothetical protein